MISSTRIKIASILIISVVVFACTGGKPTEFKLTPAKGGRYYGGTFRWNEEEYFKSLNPLNITEVIGHRICEQIYEGLVKFDDSTLAVKPCIAKRWEVDAAGKVYTFYIRDDVYFHDDPCFPGGKGRKVTAQDVKYCFDRLCFYNPAENQGFWIFKDVVKGATEYDSLTEKNIVPKEGVSGVTVLNDSTVRVELEKPYAVFLARLGLIFGKIYPKEAVDKYGSEMRVHCVGTGPFKIKTMVENQVVFMNKNENYWGVDEFGNKLPYLDAVKVTFIREKKNELLEFKKGKHDMVYRLPLEMIDEIIDADKNPRPEYQRFNVQYRASMSLQYYGFQHQRNVFKDKRIRQAFCYAIDREKICKFTLKNTGFPAIYGTVPPGTGTYDSRQIEGYTYQPEKARELLAQAGFPQGKGFGKITLQLNSGGTRNSQVAEAIKKMLEETLNIQVDLLVVPWAQHSEAVEAAKTDFYRLGWIADYPDPENFLNLFHSRHVPPSLSEKTYINSFRYINKTYDYYFDQALATVDVEQRNKLYALADQQAINDAVVLPIYYDIDFRILQPNIRNFPQNAMEYRVVEEVYLVPMKLDAK